MNSEFHLGEKNRKKRLASQRRIQTRFKAENVCAIAYKSSRFDIAPSQTAFTYN